MINSTGVYTQLRQKLILERTATCERCKRFPVEVIHHKDRNRRNNNPDNLILLCRGCHIHIHKDMRKTDYKTGAS